MSTPQQIGTATPQPRIHAMSCEYPEGCSCGASLHNALVATVVFYRTLLTEERQHTEDLKAHQAAELTAARAHEEQLTTLWNAETRDKAAVMDLLHEAQDQRDSLRAQLAANEQELAEAKKWEASWAKSANEADDRLKAMLQQLAARDATIAGLREALIPHIADLQSASIKLYTGGVFPRTALELAKAAEELESALAQVPPPKPPTT